MASITIRNLDEQTKHRLRIRAAHKNCSMEEEARRILSAALAEEERTQLDLAAAIRRHFEPLGGVELLIPARDAEREPPQFES